VAVIYLRGKDRMNSSGHKNPSTTEQYKQSNIEALKKQVNFYHPIQ
jgi:hypothetical protein